MRVLDRNGVELRTGDAVRRFIPQQERWVMSAMDGAVQQIERGSLLVEFVKGSPRRFEARRRFSLRRSYTCPDLERIDGSEK